VAAGEIVFVGVVLLAPVADRTERHWLVLRVVLVRDAVLARIGDPCHLRVVILGEGGEPLVPLPVLDGRGGDDRVAAAPLQRINAFGAVGVGDGGAVAAIGDGEGDVAQRLALDATVAVILVGEPGLAFLPRCAGLGRGRGGVLGALVRI